MPVAYYVTRATLLRILRDGFTSGDITFLNGKTIKNCASIIPYVDASCDLGDAAHRFRNIWGTNYIIGDNVIQTNRKMSFKPVSTSASPAEGDVYMDSTTHKLRCYDGTSWHDLF